MNSTLGRPLTTEELGQAVRTMASEKSPGTDGISAEFYSYFWPLIGEEFTEMINLALARGTLPPGMTQGLITLIYKSRERQDLSNWRPITLLNVSYKILAKALQLRLKPMMTNIIDPDQTAFLPLRFILDNVVLVHELLDWAKLSHQPLIFLKLDFRKAFDTVNLDFLLAAMTRLGMDKQFLDMVQLLFKGVQAAVLVNGGKSRTFQIHRGVRQGCPLSPYLYLIIAQALNALIKSEL